MISVNDRVICVDDSIKAGMLLFVGNSYPNWIKQGEEYTVREILPNDDIVPGILLEEVRNPEIFITLLGRMAEPMFRIDRFKKLEYNTLETVEEKEELITEHNLLPV